MTSTAVKTDETVERIPASLGEQAIFQEFLTKYLGTYDEISAYNSEVLREKDSEWNSFKLMDKARELARPVSGDANTNIKEALEAWEALASEVNRAKQNVLQITAKELGIDYAAGTERDPEVEAPLKEKRKVAINIGEQLTKMAELLMNTTLKEDITSFLDTYKMPAVGRNQEHSFTADGSSGAPKYRIRISVSREETGEPLFSEDGITKTVGALTKYYERGKSLKAEHFRGVWEGAGNSMSNTPTPEVSFTDNGLVFVMTQKK